MIRPGILVAFAAVLLPGGAGAQSMGGMLGMTMPAGSSSPAAGPPPSMPAMTMGVGGGAYQQGSGTARLPADEGAMRGYMVEAGDWMLMAHGYAWATLTHQAGPRGDDGHFVTSMAMLMADRDLTPRLHLQLKGMMSLDPALGPRGYPDLFASGETAHGVPLIDRQHPHDLFMELSARADYRFGGDASVFVYGGPVAEPALGPSAFMHRGSAALLPLAPISHHWFDSTHISYGVVTGGIATGHWQLESSAFRGREPDEHRWDVETPALDSWSVRATWTPSPHWAVQASTGFLHSPEAQEPDADERRTTASVNYATRQANGGGLATTLGWAVKDKRPGRALAAWLAEANWSIDRHHSLFGRIESVRNDEFFPNPASPLHDRPFRVAKAEGGYAYRMAITGPLGVALGGTLAGYAKPATLDPVYGDAPVSWTLFAKFALGL
ncbi:MAG: hypothetical protein ACRYFW_13070 [Janthinobacterium lividum]